MLYDLEGGRSVGRRRYRRILALSNHWIEPGWNVLLSLNVESLGDHSGSITEASRAGTTMAHVLPLYPGSKVS